MFYRITFTRSQRRAAKEYQGRVDAVTAVAINRYNCGMTVGHGWYKRFAGADPVGSQCSVLGWMDDGRVSVALPVGGTGLLGRGDIEVVAWPDYVPAERRAEWDSLPRISRVIDGELQV